MSAISDFAGKVNTAFTGIAASVDGIVADIGGLKKQIADLQNSTGALSPEDQAALHALLAQRDELLAALREACAEHDGVERLVAQWYKKAQQIFAKIEKAGGECNARLIASAPTLLEQRDELLAALKAALAKLELARAIEHANGTKTGIDYAVTEQCRKAIANATKEVL